MLFVATIKYSGSFTDIEPYIPSHKSYILELIDRNKVLLAGPSPNKDGGTIILISNNENEAHSILKDDPFIINNIATYSLEPVTPLDIHSDIKSIIYAMISS